MAGTGVWDDEYDVVVAGSGAGAMTGALTAASNGLRTVVLEKTSLLGGTSAYAGAAVWLPGTRVQERAGIGDSTESARAYLRALLGEDADGRREAFLATAPEVAEFLERDPAIEFEWRPFPDYYAVPGRMDAGRSFVPLDLPAERLGGLASLVRPPVDRDRTGRGHAGGALAQGRALIGRLLLALTNTGNATVRTGVRLRRLVVENGGVTGVEVDTADGPARIRAARGVLLAAGGFEGNGAMRAEHGVPGAAEWSMAPAGANTGDPILAAVAAGAATELMDQAWWCPGVADENGRGCFTLGFRGGLVVDSTGRRFANESLPYDRMGRKMAAAPERVPAYLVFDSRHADALPAISIPSLPRSAWVEAGSLDELAEKLGLPADALAATVERFNGFARDGVDADFHRGEDPYDLFFAGRSEGAGPNPCLIPVDRPPYYAARLVLSDLGTKGGLRTDTEGRVLDGAGRPIAGLYAAGNTSASFSGRVYPGPGVPIGSAMVFAYRAARDMAENMAGNTAGNTVGDLAGDMRPSAPPGSSGDVPEAARRVITVDPTDLDAVRAALAGWLAERLGADGPVRLSGLTRPAHSGMSSVSVLFDAEWTVAGEERRTSLVARLAPRPSTFPVFPGYDIRRQFEVMRAVARHTEVPVPEVHWLEESGDVLGVPFLVMSRADGRVPVDNPPYVFDGWLRDATARERREVQDSGVAVLAGVHGLAGAAGLLPDLAAEAGEDALRGHVERERAYYEWTRRDDGVRIPVIEDAFAWLEENWPADPGPPVLLWGDARVGNIVYGGTRPVAVLDWEMAALGPRETDLGWFVFLHRFFQDIAEVLEAPGLPGFCRRSDVVEEYERRTGHRVRDLDFYLTYAALRHAIVMSQIRRRAIRFGEETAPPTPDEYVMHHAALRDLVAGTYAWE
ncbi:FAD-binding protein [Microtetraspora malaysiensis]|uniref:FAD-binding protein n=1 Tax=Microtetraspora malaysiensis TaxID=161358 RepID=UPI003D8C50C6